MSELKSDTARINGAKSSGPVTPEGKARSSANSRKHGFNSDTIILPTESEEHYQLLLQDFLDQFQPQTAIEADLVEIMAASRWRLRRLLAIESHQLLLEMNRRKKQIAEEFPNPGPNVQVAYVFQKLSDHGNSLKLILRYEATINRSYNNALKQLQQLQANRPPAPPEAPVGSFRNPPQEPSNPPPPSPTNGTATDGSGPHPLPSPDSYGGVSPDTGHQ